METIAFSNNLFIDTFPSLLKLVKSYHNIFCQICRNFDVWSEITVLCINATAYVRLENPNIMLAIIMQPLILIGIN